ncbi:hypothetical protein DL95DRAFT_486663 [Leptodontidium sp. 2 PMI_412]|nr:hypothetical protein DL95DRAFT_486663 [Leptodontidium sp. 2 PMI_412]
MRISINPPVTISATYAIVCDPAHQYPCRASPVSNVPPPSPPDGNLTVNFTTTLTGSSGPPTPLTGFFNATLFPLQQQQNVTDFLEQAAELSMDWAIHQFFQDQCITQQVYPSLFSQPAGFVTPFSPFDNFYFVRYAFVSA